MGTERKAGISVARKAVFLDRDGTLIRNHHYGCDAAHIELLDGVVEGLRCLQEASYRLVVVTNQSGIARGYFDEQQLTAMHKQLAALLRRQGVAIAAFYYCPHHAEGVIPRYTGFCECRKPGPGMILRAAREQGIDLGESWLVGDILDDVEAGNRAGCRSILIDLGTESAPTTKLRTPVYVARDIWDATSFILRAAALVRAAAGS